jgi:hypothetical protein
MWPTRPGASSATALGACGGPKSLRSLITLPAQGGDSENYIHSKACSRIPGRDPRSDDAKLVHGVPGAVREPGDPQQADGAMPSGGDSQKGSRSENLDDRVTGSSVLQPEPDVDSRRQRQKDGKQYATVGPLTLAGQRGGYRPNGGPGKELD